MLRFIHLVLLNKADSVAEQVEVEMSSGCEYLVTSRAFILPSAVTWLAQCFGGSLLYFEAVPNTS